MKTTYWITGLLVVGLGAGEIGMANAHQFGFANGFTRPSFEALDTNGDGKLTQDEMNAQKSVQFNKTDSNGDGMLSADEMMVRGKARANERMAKRIGYMIERRDANKDGMLSLEELGQMSSGNRLFQRLDADGDGVISAEEFDLRKAERWGWRRGKMMTE